MQLFNPTEEREKGGSYSLDVGTLVIALRNVTGDRSVICGENRDLNIHYFVVISNIFCRYF